METECPTFCPADWAPVCGSNGKTYSNRCRLEVASCRSTMQDDPAVEMVHEGVCKAGHGRSEGENRCVRRCQKSTGQSALRTARPTATNVSSRSTNASKQITVTKSSSSTPVPAGRRWPEEPRAMSALSHAHGSWPPFVLPMASHTPTCAFSTGQPVLRPEKEKRSPCCMMDIAARK